MGRRIEHRPDHKKYVRPRGTSFKEQVAELKRMEYNRRVPLHTRPKAVLFRAQVYRMEWFFITSRLTLAETAHDKKWRKEALERAGLKEIHPGVFEILPFSIFTKPRQPRKYEVHHDPRSTRPDRPRGNRRNHEGLSRP